MKKLNLLGLLLGLALSATVHGEEANTAIKAADRLWLQQDLSGAISMGLISLKKNTVISYHSCFAAQGLVAVYVKTRNKVYLDRAMNWVDWYKTRQNQDGTIYDSQGSASDWKSTGQFDSTDSYAAVYIDLLNSIWSACSDKNWLKAQKPSIDRAMAGIRLTLQKNGLTLAKPGYPVMYAMDNIEVLLGLRSAAVLYQALGDSYSSATTKALADGVEKAIQELIWSKELGYYRVGIQLDGGKMEGLKDWYPDVMANLMAIGWLPPAKQNQELFETLKDRFGPMMPETVKSVDDLDHLVWWGWAAIGAGDAKTLKVVQKRLANFEQVCAGGCNPGVLGHIARISLK